MKDRMLYEAPALLVIACDARDVICSSLDPQNILEEDRLRMRRRD